MKPVNFKDLTGKRFGKLTVIEYQGFKNRRSWWLCKCDCGREKAYRGDMLPTYRSCGICVLQVPHTTKSDRRLSNILQGMRRRCTNINCRSYKDYGGRGIKVCEEWSNKKDGLINFRKWAYSHGYNDNLSIDRIDNDKGYSPDNCRWATQHEQRVNQRQKSISYNGETVTLRKLSEITGITYDTLLYRYNKGYRNNELVKHDLRKGE